MIREIVIWPDPRLAQKSVVVPDDECGDLADFVKDMFDTLYDSGGVGLAAIQLGVPLRVFVMDVREPYVFINPKIVGSLLPREMKNEGCLSLPGIIEQVERWEGVDVEYQDQTGAKFVKRFQGLEAQCCQHEIDHLDGITLPDKLGPVRRDRVTKKMAKWWRKLEQP